MSRRIEEPVQACGALHPRPGTPCPHSPCAAPACFVWRGRRIAVRECLDEWYETGRWWDGEGEKRFVQVLTADRGIYELGYDVATGQWQLYRVVD
ncbi:MAG: DUF6504 family protein [Bacillota bacterium]